MQVETIEIQFFAEDLTAGDEPLGGTAVSIEAAVMGVRPKPPKSQEAEEEEQQEGGREEEGGEQGIDFVETSHYSRELRMPGWHPPWRSGVQGAVEFTVTWTEAPPPEQGGLRKFSHLGDDVSAAGIEPGHRR